MQLKNVHSGTYIPTLGNNHLLEISACRNKARSCFWKVHEIIYVVFCYLPEREQKLLNKHAKLGHIVLINSTKWVEEEIIEKLWELFIILYGQWKDFKCIKGQIINYFSWLCIFSHSLCKKNNWNYVNLICYGNLNLILTVRASRKCWNLFISNSDDIESELK